MVHTIFPKNILALLQKESYLQQVQGLNTQE